MGQRNQQMHLVGAELSSHDIGSGCCHAPLAITLTTSTPRWTRCRMAAEI
jgi:hypothetical protein